MTALAAVSEISFKGNKSLLIFGRDGFYNTVSNALFQMRKTANRPTPSSRAFQKLNHITLIEI